MRERAAPKILQSITDGSLFRKRFIRRYSDSKYNLAISISGDGVTKSALTVKTVFPLSIRVESVNRRAKSDLNVQHMVALVPGDYGDLQLYLCLLSAELKKLAELGAEIDIPGVGIRRVRVCTILIAADCRALQSLAGKYRDPALQYACPNCLITGRRYENRTVYVEEERGPAEEYRLGDSTGPRFKCIPSLGYGVRNIEETLAICYAHNLKNVIVRIFEMHGNVGAAKLTDALRTADEKRPVRKRTRSVAGSADTVPWRCDGHKVTVLEARILHAVSGMTPKSPFQNKSDARAKELRAKEIYTGMAGIRVPYVYYKYSCVCVSVYCTFI